MLWRTPLTAWWRARSKRMQALLIIAALFLAYAFVSPTRQQQPAQGPGTGPTATAPAVAVAATTAVPTGVPTHAALTPTPAPTPFNFGAGRKIVVTDVRPGTYRTRTPSAGCYFERLSGLGGTFAEIKANGNSSGPVAVTIAGDDRGFNSTRCGTWTADLSAIKTPNSPFGEGTFIVGVDIAPGTWRSSEGGTCYWQRTRGFSWTVDDIIANENASAPTIVAIAATDKGFTSTRCGTWTKIG